MTVRVVWASNPSLLPIVASNEPWAYKRAAVRTARRPCRVSGVGCRLDEDGRDRRAVHPLPPGEFLEACSGKVGRSDLGRLLRGQSGLLLPRGAVALLAAYA